MISVCYCNISEKRGSVYLHFVSHLPMSFWFNFLPYMAIREKTERERFPEKRAERWREAWSIVVFMLWCKVSSQNPVITLSPSTPVVSYLSHIKDGLIENVGAACCSMNEPE